MLNKFYLLFLFISILALSSVNSISVTSSTRQGVFEVEFDQDIGVTKTFGQCVNRTCAPTSACAPCDYTDPDVCAGSRASGPCACPVGPICNITNVLRLDEPFAIYVGPDEVADFKVFLETEFGDPDLYVASARKYNTEGFTSAISDRYGPETAIICPADLEYDLGTLAVEVYSFPSEFFALGVGAKITLTISLHDIPQPVAAPLSCTPTSADHTCLTDDEMLHFIPSSEAEGLRYFELSLPQTCTPISFFSSRGTKIYFSYADPKPTLLEDQPSVFYRAVDDSGGLQRDAFVLCPQDLGVTKLYMAVTSTKNESYIGVSTNPGWVFYEPLTRYNPFQYVFETYATSMLSCPAFETVFVCFYKIYEDNDCELYWTVSPTADAVPLFPRPSFTTGQADFNQIMLIDAPTNPLSTKFVAVVMLNYTLDLKTTVIATEDTISDCSMKFLGRLVDANRAPLQMTVNFEEKNLECDAAKLQSTTDKMKELLAEQQDIVQGQRLSDIRYQLDVTAMYDNTYGCREFVTQLYESTLEEVQIGTANCLADIHTVEYAVDPCCNQTLSWTGPACSMREVPYEVSAFVSSDTEQCYAPRCLETFIQDYFEKSSVASDIILGCSSSTPRELPYRTELFAIYGLCKDLAFGVFPKKGIPCSSDAECNGEKCDMLLGRCLISVSSQYDTFWNCFLAATDPFVLTTIESNKNIQPSSKVGAAANLQQWKSSFTQSDCVGTYDLALDYRRHWSLDPGFESTVCPQCESFQCLDKRCIIPYECDNYIQGQCFKAWTEIVPEQSTCTGVNKCNWFDCSTLADPKNCSVECLSPVLTASFCGLTEDGQSFVEIASITDSNSCTSATGCILHDKTVTAEASESACTSKQRCNAVCYTGSTPRACVDESECTSSGECIGDEFLEPNGACVFATAPYQNPPCPYNRLNTDPTITTYYGCIDTSIPTALQCTNSNGTWMLPANTQAECEAFGNGCLEPFISFTFNSGNIVSRKDETNCLAAAGQYIPLMTWRPGTWQGGLVRELTWQARAVFNPYSIQPTIDFVSLYDEINLAIDTKYAFELKTQSKCFYGQQFDLLNVVSCSCNPSGEASEKCFDSYDATSTDAVNVICQGVNGTLDANNVVAYYFADTLKADRACITIGLGAVSTGEFKFNTKDPLSSFLIDFSEESEFAFTNGLDAIVGRLIGDGVSFTFSDASLTSLNVCTKIETAPNEAAMKRFPILDIGQVDVDTKAVTPMGIEMRVSGDEYCGTIESVESANVVYFPIIRVDNWSTARPSVAFTDGEIALLVISVVCYAFCLVFAIVKSAIILHYRLYKQLNFVVLLLLAALCLGGVFSTQNARGVYIIVELPSFLYFSALSFFVVLWIFTMRLIHQPSISRRVMNKRIVSVVAIINGVLYAIFIVLIILYETLSEDDVAICGGRFISRDLNTRQTIAMVYRLIVSILSLALGVGYLINGFRVYWNMVQSDKKSGKVSDKEGTKRRIFWTATICSIGLLLQCAFLLTLLFTGYRNNVVAMAILIAVEVVPVLTVVSILRTGDAKQKMSRSTVSATRRSLNFGSTASKEVTNSGDVASHQSDDNNEMNMTANSATITTASSSDRVQTPLKPKTPKTPKTPTTHRVIEVYPDVDELPSEESSSSSSEMVPSLPYQSRLNMSSSNLMSARSFITPVNTSRVDSNLSATINSSASGNNINASNASNSEHKPAESSSSSSSSSSESSSAQSSSSKSSS